MSTSAVRLVSLAVAASIACRELPPTSGTPLEPGESLEQGVTRGQSVHGVRSSAILASCEKIAADVVLLLDGAGAPESDGTRPPIVLLAPRNVSSLPEPGFVSLRIQLLDALVHAGAARGLELVPPSDDAAPADGLVLGTAVVGGIREGGYFVVEYELFDAGEAASARSVGRAAMIVDG